MRFSILAALAVLALSACSSHSAQPVVAYWSETSPCSGVGQCSRDAGVVYPDAGVFMDSVNAYDVYVCPSSGNSLLGGGTLEVYRCSGKTGLCAHDHDLELTLDATQAGPNCAGFATFKVGNINPDGDLLIIAPLNVTVNDGGYVTTYVEPHRER